MVEAAGEPGGQRCGDDGCGIEWQDDEVTLWQRYRSDPDPAVRPRWHALWLLGQGRSATETAALIGVHRCSVQRWLAW